MFKIVNHHLTVVRDVDKVADIDVLRKNGTALFKIRCEADGLNHFPVDQFVDALGSKDLEALLIHADLLAA